LLLVGRIEGPPDEEACMEAHEPEPALEGRDRSDLFPFHHVREGQRQFLEDARSCMLNRVDLLADAPTGLGKTAVGLSASLEAVLPNGGAVLFLTARQSQHRAAIETSRYIWRSGRVKVVDLISKQDTCLCRGRDGAIPCAEAGDCYFLDRDRVGTAAQRLLEYPLHVGEAMRLCVRLGACPHLAARTALPSADLVVCDYNHVFSGEDRPIQGDLDRPSGSIALVVDEAHNLPGRIMENFSRSIARSQLSPLLKGTGNRQFKPVVRTILDFIDRNAFEHREGPIPPEELDEELRSNVGMDAAALAKEMVGHHQGRSRRRMEDLAQFLERWSSCPDACVRFVDGAKGTVHIRFIEPRLVSGPVFEGMRCSLLMSGTLHPPQRFAEALGLVDTAVCRQYPSPFPAGNRKVLVVRSVTSRYDRRDESTYRSMAEVLAQTCGVVPGNLVAFFPSYEFLGRTEHFLRAMPMTKRTLVERRDMAKAEKDALLMDLSRDRSGLLLATIGGSFAEGVDFRDNLLSAVVVVGLPLSPPSVEGQAIAERLERRLGPGKAIQYSRTYPAVTKVLQAAGRAIRSESDRAAIILLDDRYLASTIRAAFPADLHMEESHDLRSELEWFYSKNEGAPCQTVGPGDPCQSLH
jgi:DNA excision repair protein ERCC-2